MLGRRYTSVLAGGVAAVIWSFFVGDSHTFTVRAQILVGAAIVVMVVLLAPRIYRHGRVSLDVRAAVVWGSAALAVTTVELVNLFHGPRSEWPTISSLTNGVVGTTDIGRTLMALAWLGLGVWLAVCGS